jgi:hypothetical protein
VVAEWPFVLSDGTVAGLPHRQYPQAAPSPSETSMASDYPNADHAWQAGRYPAADRAVARQVIRATDENGKPDLMYNYHDRDPYSGSHQPMTVGNGSGGHPISYSTSRWTPSLDTLRAGVENTAVKYPLLAPEERSEVSLLAADVIDAKARQDVSKMAYGSLEEVGDGYDSDDAQSRYARDVSVDAAFDVQTTSTIYEKERRSAQSIQGQRAYDWRQAEQQRNIARAAGGYVIPATHPRKGSHSPDSPVYGGVAYQTHKPKRRGN